MPPDPVPVVRLRAAVVVVVLRCFKLLPPADERGLANLLGERVPLPTDVELAGAGYKVCKQNSMRIDFVASISMIFTFDCDILFALQC